MVIAKTEFWSSKNIYPSFFFIYFMSILFFFHCKRHIQTMLHDYLNCATITTLHYTAKTTCGNCTYIAVILLISYEILNATLNRIQCKANTTHTHTHTRTMPTHARDSKSFPYSKLPTWCASVSSFKSIGSTIYQVIVLWPIQRY